MHYLSRPFLPTWQRRRRNRLWFYLKGEDKDRVCGPSPSALVAPRLPVPCQWELDAGYSRLARAPLDMLARVSTYYESLQEGKMYICSP